MGDGGGGHWLVLMEWQCGTMVSVSASVNLPLHHKVKSSLLAPAHLDGPGKRAVKRLWCGGGGYVVSKPVSGVATETEQCRLMGP